MNIKKMVSALILKAEGGFSFSKMWIWLAAVTGFIGEVNTAFISADIAIPHQLLPYFKIAALVSALIAGIRLRTAASGDRQVQVPPPNLPSSK